MQIVPIGGNSEKSNVQLGGILRGALIGAVLTLGILAIFRRLSSPSPNPSTSTPVTSETPKQTSTPSCPFVTQSQIPRITDNPTLDPALIELEKFLQTPKAIKQVKWFRLMLSLLQF